MSGIIRRLNYMLMLVLTLSISACHANKDTTGKYTGDVDLTTVNDAPAEQLFSQLAASYQPWTDLYVPVQLSLESPKKMSISGRATMIYGKEIYISLRLLGMEVGYVYINQDKAWVVDKYHKCYFAEDISKIASNYGIGITDLQDLLLGRAVIPGGGVISESDVDKFTYLTSDDQWIMTPTKAIDGADWHYMATKTQPPMLQSVSLRLKKSVAAECRFAEPTETVAGIVDGVSTLTLPYKDEDIRVSITWMMNDAKWNSGREIQFNLPSSYRKLDVENLLKSLSMD